MFKDYIEIKIQAGNGGNGARSFRKEKYVPDGGPDGGDGGKGGDLIFKARSNINTLSEFRYKKLYKAEDGKKGEGSNKTGLSGNDLILNVPVGTVLYKDGKKLTELVEDGEEKIILKGGKGGLGNARFKTSTRQAPNFAIDGEKTEEVDVVLELKLIADVGLVGFPNAGKSTFLSTVTNARPKIANYPFTTLIPNLGVVDIKEGSFVIADIPGIIEGASKGIGLGDKFLKHIERNRVLLILIDISGIEQSAKSQVDQLMHELKAYSNELMEKEMIFVATKMDIKDDEQLEYIEKYTKKNNIKLFKISSVTKENVNDLLKYIVKRLSEIPNILEKVEEENIYTLDNINNDGAVIQNKDRFKDFTVRTEKRDVMNLSLLKSSAKEILKDGKILVFIVEGPAIERLVGRVNINERESMNYFHKMLDTIGVTKELKKQGIKNGDTVEITGINFEWHE